MMAPITRGMPNGITEVHRITYTVIDLASLKQYRVFSRASQTKYFVYFMLLNQITDPEYTYLGSIMKYMSEIVWRCYVVVYVVGVNSPREALPVRMVLKLFLGNEMEHFLIMHASLQDCFSDIIQLFSSDICKVGYFVLNELKSIFLSRTISCVWMLEIVY